MTDADVLARNQVHHVQSLHYNVLTEIAGTDPELPKNVARNKEDLARISIPGVVVSLQAGPGRLNAGQRTGCSPLLRNNKEMPYGPARHDPIIRGAASVKRQAAHRNCLEWRHQATLEFSGMRTVGMFLFLALSINCFGQIPPGDPYDPKRHSNPIVTYVEHSDFRTSTFQEVLEEAGIEPLGLSQSVAARESFEIAGGGVREIEILRRDVRVTFYPVVRQTYQLADGGSFVLYSFKNFRSRVPPGILNALAFAQTKEAKDARFGLSSRPEQLEIRRAAALLFDNDGELTLFWQEDGVSHAAMASIGRDELFRVVEDLL